MYVSICKNVSSCPMSDTLLVLVHKGSTSYRGQPTTDVGRPAYHRRREVAADWHWCFNKQAQHRGMHACLTSPPQVQASETVRQTINIRNHAQQTIYIQSCVAKVHNNLHSRKRM